MTSTLESRHLSEESYNDLWNKNNRTMGIKGIRMFEDILYVFNYFKQSNTFDLQSELPLLYNTRQGEMGTLVPEASIYGMHK